MGHWMKTLLGMIAIGLALWFQPALSAPWDFRPHLQQGQERRSAPRQAPPNKGERRQQRAAPAGDDRQRHRLSDEERRDLRRDLDRANRELYRRKGQR
jgi:hypothetical protein